MHIDIIDLGFQGRAGAIASFLITGTSGKFLIETGPESTLPCLLEKLTGLGVAPQELAGVIVTHIHLDHAGAAGWFAAQGVPVYVHTSGASRLIDPARLVASARGVYGDQFDPLWGGMTPAPPEQVIALADGERWDLAGVSIEAIATPGHAFHQHAFMIDGAFFTGDATGAIADDSGYISVTAAPPQFVCELKLETIERLRSYRPDTLYLTHFGAVQPPQDHLNRYREAVQRASQFVEQHLLAHPDGHGLHQAYTEFQQGEAAAMHCSPQAWDTLKIINSPSMCADGIRRYWEKKWSV